jgi:sec-independent protein translocase protein TatA
MLGNIGPATLILIVIVALLLFGPSKLPELGRALGKTLREFKNGTKDAMNEEDPTNVVAKKEIHPASRQDSVASDKDNKRLPD